MATTAQDLEDTKQTDDPKNTTDDAQDQSSQDASSDDNNDSKPKRKRSSRSRSKKSGDSKGDSGSSSSRSKPSRKSTSIKRMLINYVPGDECRVALVEDGKLDEIHTEFADSQSLVGNIYVGRVTNVEASIQAAFIDFGHHTNGFLHISDLHPQYFPGEDDETKERIGMKTPRRERPAIQQCLKKGQRVLVQVIKEGINTKGPTLSSYLSIPGRYMVMLPSMDKVGVSRKVEDEDMRREARRILDQLDLPEGFGFILRTAGFDRTKTELKRDLAYLQRLQKDIDRRLKKGGNQPRLLYAESDLMMRTLRDLWTSDIAEIVIDNERAAARAARFMKIVSPRTSTRLLQYDQPEPMFFAYGVEDQIKQILARQVPLPSGGSLVVDETEAVVAIDVNSGRMRSHGDAETTAFKTNSEAVPEICRQLRLRDVGGLVICDLIDMMKRSNRRDIETLFKDCLKSDRAATKALPISQFGIVELTRQRMKGSMRSQHFMPGSAGGRAMVRRPDSVAREALRELARLLAVDRIHRLEMVLSPRMAGEFLSNRRQALSRIELRYAKSVAVRVSDSIPSDRVVFYAYDERGGDVAIDRLPGPKAPRSSDLIEWTVGSAADDDDLADDLKAEEEEQQAVTAQALQDDGDDQVLAALESTDDDDEDDDEESGGGRRRRRRGGRRRRGKRSGDGEDSSDDSSQDDSQPSRGSSDPDDDDDEGSPGGRRRRRRRGGRGRRRGGSDSDAGEDSTDRPAPARSTGGGTPIFDPAANPNTPPPKDQTGRPPVWRNDSWDLEPGEDGRMAVKPDFSGSVSSDDNGADSSANGSPSRGGSGKRRSRRSRSKDKALRAGMDRASAAKGGLSDRLSKAPRLGQPLNSGRAGKRSPRLRGLVLGEARRMPRLGVATGDPVDALLAPVEGSSSLPSPRRILPNQVFTVSVRLGRIAEIRARRRRRGGRNRRSRRS